MGIGKKSVGGSAKEPERAYHHGDLRAALLLAAEQEIIENGVIGFSLRATARRAEVSHAAPAHHFGNAEALLAAVTQAGFVRLSAAISSRLDAAEQTPAARLAAAGKGYIAFAQHNPQIFRLMFTKRPGDIDKSPCHPPPAQGQTFGQLLTCVGEIVGPGADSLQMASAVAGAWGLVHGLANLMADGVATFLDAYDAAQREKIIDTTLENFAAALDRRVV